MSDRHVFHDHTTLVLRSLKGLVASHPYLALIPSLKTVYRADYDRSKVTLISGSGSGHEPGTAGHVGRGLLTASVAGDVFASPSARQVYGAVHKLPSDKGVILIITNYTGDNLHFGLAKLMAQSAGVENIELVVVGDDVSVPRSRGNLVGRRCLAGITLVCKILGAGAEEDMGFRELVDLGRSASTNTGSICAALDHCHVPGRSGDWQLPEGRVEIGLGLHNETGVFNIPTPKGEDLIAQMLDLILKQDDPERSFVKFKKDDEIVLLLNNQGALSVLEMGAILDEVLTQLEAKGIIPVRILNGLFISSMNMPGFSISLTNLSNIESETGVSVQRQLELIDAPHNSVAWPQCAGIYPVPKELQKKREERFTEVEKEAKAPVKQVAKIPVDPKQIQAAMKTASDDVIALEPKLTEWDTIVGDGDCGETCASGAKGVLEAMKTGLGSDGDLVHFFRELTETIDDSCGGTLGAIFSIFLAGFTNSLIAAAPSSPKVDPAFFGKTALEALETLGQRTAARKGHRTVMDSLIPFAESLAETGDLAAAVKAARQGGEATATMQAKLGRATYIGERSDRVMPPDPGAMAFVAVVEGIAKALGQ